MSISIYRILENIDIDKDNLAILEYIDIGKGICKKKYIERILYGLRCGISNTPTQ